MIKKVLTAGILISSFAVMHRAVAQTYDANAAFQANELGGNELIPTFGPFSVGYQDRSVANSFSVFSAAEHTNAFNGNGNTQGFLTVNNVIVPAAAVNVSASPFSGAFGLDAGEIFLHPGGRGPDGFAPPIFDGVLRFTAPSAGLYTIRGNFRSLDGGITENSILRNGAPVVTFSNQGAFRVTLSLASNETIDFSVGAGSDGIGGDSTALTATLVKGAPAPQVVNIDFQGKRPGDAGDAGLFVGSGAAGGGTIFNALVADSTGGNDNLTVSGSNLLNDSGAVTTVGFSIGPVGGDYEPSQGTEPASLYDDYVFNNSAGNNTPGGSPFTISGLGDATLANVYFYGSFGIQAFSVNGAPSAAVFGVYNGMQATAFIDVPVTGGSITGLFGVGTTGVMGGLTVESVPEPGTASLLGIAGLAALLRRRRR